MSDTHSQSRSWADDERDVAPPLISRTEMRSYTEPESRPYTEPADILNAGFLEITTPKFLEKRQKQTPIHTPQKPKTPPPAEPMADVKLQFMDCYGSLKPGGNSAVIPSPTYYRARSAKCSAYSSRSFRTEREWRYFNSEKSQYIDRDYLRNKLAQESLPKSRPQTTVRQRREPRPKTTPATLPNSRRGTSGKDLHNQCSLSNKLLNVMTIDDYQERYYGRRVKSASRFGHKISRASSASTRLGTAESRNLIRQDSAGTSKTESRPGSTKRPASSKAESGIYDVQSESEFAPKQSDIESTAIRDLPLEYYATLDESADSENAIVSRGFDILMNSNELVHPVMRLYRDPSNVGLKANQGSEFFKRLKATLRYQLLVGTGLPSKMRYERALRMHSTADAENDDDDDQVDDDDDDDD